MAFEYDFSERMDTGRAVAQERRNRGFSTGKPAKGWNARRPHVEDTEIGRLHAELADVHAQLRQAKTDLAGGSLEPIDDYGAEFDRLVGRGLPASPRIIAPHSKAREGTKGSTMTTKQYLAALKKLGLKPSARETAEALGLSVRQCQRIAAERCSVPEPVAKLLGLYLEHGLSSSDE